MRKDESQYKPPSADEIINVAIDVCLKTGQHPPAILMVGDRQVDYGLIEQMPDHALDRVMSGFRHGMETRLGGEVKPETYIGNLIRVAWISEAWMTAFKVEKDTEEMTPELKERIGSIISQLEAGVPAADIQGVDEVRVIREEVLLISIINMDGTADNRTLRMIRSESGEMIDLADATMGILTDAELADVEAGNAKMTEPTPPLLLAVVKGWEIGQAIIDGRKPPEMPDAS